MSYTFKEDDLQGFVAFTGAATKTKGDELFFKLCPYCNGGDSKDAFTFSVNTDSGCFNCFRSGCGKTGHFAELARDFNFPIEYEDSHKKKRYKSLVQKEIVVRDPAITYFASRGISESIVRAYKLTTMRSNDKVVVFPFYDDTGLLVSAKYRRIDFNKEVDKNKEWFEKDTKPILFGMSQCKSFDTLVITEGQIDSLSCAECGIENAVSVPTGAKGFTWIEHCYDWVMKFAEIIVFGDREGEHITLADEISQRFSGKVVKVVRVADYLGEKDANDILVKYGKDAVLKAIQNAEIPPIKSVKKMSSVKRRDRRKVEKIKTGIFELDKCLHGMEGGQVILVTGRRGEGKSVLTSQIFVNVVEQGYPAMVYSGELQDYAVKEIMEFQIAGDSRIMEERNEWGEPEYFLTAEDAEKISDSYFDRVFLYDNTILLDENKSPEDALIPTIEKVVCRYGVRFILIDNLMIAVERTAKGDLYTDQSNFVKKVKMMAMKYNAAILLVAHPRKEQKGEELGNDSVSGTSDITNLVDAVLTYERNKDENAGFESYIGVTKSRWHGDLREGKNRIHAHYSRKSKRISTVGDNSERSFSCFTQTNSISGSGYAAGNAETGGFASADGIIDGYVDIV